MRYIVLYWCCFSHPVAPIPWSYSLRPRPSFNTITLLWYFYSGSWAMFHYSYDYIINITKRLFSCVIFFFFALSCRFSLLHHFVCTHLTQLSARDAATRVKKNIGAEKDRESAFNNDDGITITRLRKKTACEQKKYICASWERDDGGGGGPSNDIIAINLVHGRIWKDGQFDPLMVWILLFGFICPLWRSGPMAHVRE